MINDVLHEMYLLVLHQYHDAEISLVYGNSHYL